jgi:hypothetical protein
MRNVRPIRLHSTYSAFCVGCGEEIEVPAMPVPMYCVVCTARRAAELAAELAAENKKAQVIPNRFQPA